MSNNEFHQRRLSATPRGVGVMCNFFAQSAENATLKDVEGNEYIDFAAGIAVLNTGHRHPDLVAAVEQQLQQFTHTAYQIVPYESYVTLAEKINALAPVSGQAKTAFFTTGAEAVENAVKIARAHTGRPGVIAFSGGFHGRTYMTMALTGKVAPYKIGFGPFPGSVYHVPYPSDLHGISTQDSLDAIERLFKSDIEAKQVAAVLREMTGIFDLWDYCAYLGDFEIATAQKDAAAGMKILEKMLPAMLKKWEPYSSALYSRIPRKENGRNIGSLLMPRILEDLENPEAQDFDFLREVPGFTEFMKDMKEKLKK